MVRPDESSDKMRIIYRQKQLLSQTAMVSILIQFLMT